MSDGVTLLQGDCLELMQAVPDGSVDMVLTDLPYGTTQNAWDKCIDLGAFWRGVNRVLKPNGAAVLFSQLPFSADLIHSNRKNFRYEWIWEKTRGTGFLNANRAPLKIHENILVYYRALPTYHPQKTRVGCGGGIVASVMTGRAAIMDSLPPQKRRTTSRKTFSDNYGAQKETVYLDDGTRYPVDIITFPAPCCSDEPNLHPTQKPVPLLEYLVRTYTDEGETVLDCCMGSGSTGVACINTGRRFVGMELDKGYFETAAARIATAQGCGPAPQQSTDGADEAQLTLF